VRLTVKICGLTSLEDARLAAELGADYLGFVFFPHSPRCLPGASAQWIREVGSAHTVGVFRDQPSSFVSDVREAAGLKLVQLHGSETPEACAELGGRDRVIKTISVAGPLDWGRVESFTTVARLLFDTATPRGGGSGRRFDWRLLDGRPLGLVFWLAGGLRPDSVREAIVNLRPAGVDVASGVEASVGRKDPATMRAFIEAVRSAQDDLDAGRPARGREGRVV